MLPSYFGYIFVHLKQKARLRPELSPKFFVSFRPEPGPNPKPTEKAGPTNNSVEDTRLETKDRLSEDKPCQGHGQECSRPRPRTKETTRKCSPKKKTVFMNLLRDLWRSPSQRKKKYQDLDPFLTNQKLVCS